MPKAGEGFTHEATKKGWTEALTKRLREDQEDDSFGFWFIVSVVCLFDSWRGFSDSGKARCVLQSSVGGRRRFSGRSM